MNIFHISEIVDMGIEKEKKRRDFYAAAAAAFKQIDTKKLFLELRDWEQAHIEKFTMIRETLNEQETPESYPGELSAYMQALVEERLYQEVSAANFKKNVKSPVDAAIYGMGFEKDAILFSASWQSIPAPSTAR